MSGGCVSVVLNSYPYQAYMTTRKLRGITHHLNVRLRAVISHASGMMLSSEPKDAAKVTGTDECISASSSTVLALQRDKIFLFFINLLVN